ncbi:MAG: hypothetical protein ACK5YK_00010 [Pseudomonadota bacterium]|jgi:hypothetical protein
MTQLNLFDVLFLLGGVFAILLGMMRGNGRETLHTFVFAAALGVGWLFLRSGTPATTPEELARLVVSISFYAFAMYVLSWALMGLLAPFILDGHDVGLRGRFWAGAQAMMKLVGIVLGVNLWYALHSTTPVWERLQPLPPLVRESVVVNLSDRLTEDVHRWLAAQGLATYPFASQDTASLSTELPAERIPSQTLERMVDTPSPQDNE